MALGMERRTNEASLIRGERCGGNQLVVHANEFEIYMNSIWGLIVSVVCENCHCGVDSVCGTMKRYAYLQFVFDSIRLMQIVRRLV